MRPRRDRWLTLAEVGSLIAERHPKLAKATTRNLRRFVARLVRSIEKRDNERYSKRVGRELFVSRNALESLLPVDGGASIGSLEREIARVAQIQREMKRQVNGLGSRVRVIEQKQALTTDFVAKMAALDCT